MKLATALVRPPIPTREFDWCAWDDSKGEDCADMVGWGATEEAAVRDLADLMDLQESATFVKQAFALGLRL